MFCDFHDTQHFNKIDNLDIKPTKEQNVQLSIRSLGAELHKKAILFKTNLLNDKGISLYDISYHYLSLFKIAKKKEWNNLSRCIIELNNIPEIMCSTCYIPEIDFDGQIIQQDFLSSYSNMFTMEIFSDNKKNFVTFEWLRNDTICNLFIESLLKTNDIPNNIVKFIFTFCENSAFNPDWWDNLSMIKKNTLLTYSKINIETANYKEIFSMFKEDKKKYVTWNIINIKKDY